MSTAVWPGLARALSPVEDRPRVTPDLESACYTTRSGASYVVVHQPGTRAYVRLDPREFELLELMDGCHTVKELVIAYYQRHGTLALSRVAGLVGLLSQQGLLARPRHNAYAALAEQLVRKRRRVAPTSVTIRHIDAHLELAYRRWGRVFFHRRWLWIGLGLGVLGPILVAVEMTRGRYTLYDIGGSALVTLALLVGLAVFALAVHELGHGLAVKHAGRRVHEAGLRLYFGLPAAYVDTSDIWMAAPRQRVLTAFAGPWTGLVLGGVCALAVGLLPTGPIGAFLFTAAFVFLVDNLFNFNPLLELDGYYMLVDYLDRPLLRARALAFARGPLWSRLRHGRPLAPEERVLAAFGLGAIVYGVVALALAIRAWQALLQPLIVGSLTSGDLLRQASGLALLLAVATAVFAGVVGMGRRLMQPLLAGLTWLSGRTAERRHAEALAVMRAVPVWSVLPAARQLELARALRAQDVASGVEVVRQGESGECFYLVARGAFEVLVDGQPQIRLGAGDYFGERALLHRAPRAASVVAMAPGRVFVLEQAAFDTLLASDLAVRSRLEAALEYRQAVADMPLFQDLSAAELDVLLARLTPLPVEPNHVVIRQGDSGERFYVVRSGRLTVERDGSLLASLGPGDAFGEIALLLDVPRTATVRAVEPTQLLALEARDFRDLLAGYLGRADQLERLSHLRLRTHKRLDEVV